MSNKRATPDRLVAQMAAGQHGVVTTKQLEAAGVDRFAINYRIKLGRLHRIHRGVYAVGHTRLSFEGRCLAAVLACGNGAALSHRSAAALWEMLPTPPGPINVTVPGNSGRARRRGISLHRSLTLTGSVTARRSGVPVTAPIRTLADLRRTVPRAVFQRALRRAFDLRLITADALGPDSNLTRSELERLFLRLCRRHRLPRPEVNVRVGPYEVDFLWRDCSVIVETDGFRHHGSRAAFESDRARDAHLQALGYRVLRFTYRQVQKSPDTVVASLRRVIGRGR
jgi:very-short-patch-repair endonuclease